MKKPDTMSIHEWLINIVAKDVGVDASVVRKVMSHNFESIFNAVAHHDIIEIANFGKFKYGKKKALYALKTYVERKESLQETLKSKDLSDSKRFKAEEDVKKLTRKINYLIDVKKADYEQAKHLIPCGVHDYRGVDE